MPQLSLYITQEQFQRIKREARAEKMPHSKWVVSQVMNRLEPRYPDGWADLFGSITDNSFSRPDQPNLEIQTKYPIPTLRLEPCWKNPAIPSTPTIF